MGLHPTHLKCWNEISLGDFGSNGLLELGELLGHHVADPPETHGSNQDQMVP